MRRPSIVHVMGWRSQQYGSFERFLVALVRGARERGLDSHLVFHAEPASAAFVADCDATLHVLPPPSSPATAAHFGRGLRRILHETEATHLHSHFGSDAYLAVALARSQRRFTTKHISPGRSWRSLSPLRHRWLASEVEAFFAVSHHVADGLLALGVPAEKVEVAYLGVDPDAYRPDAERRAATRAALGLADGTRLVLSTSHLRPGKGVELLPALAKRLSKAPGSVTVALAGDGPLRPELERAAEKSANGSLRLLGVREDVPDLLGAADVVVFPTAGQEGLPLGPLEALAAGAPLVASGVSDLPSLIGDAAVLVPPGNFEELLAGCRRVLSDADLRHSLSEAGRRAAAERLSVQRGVEQHLARYLETSA